MPAEADMCSGLSFELGTAEEGLVSRAGLREGGGGGVLLWLLFLTFTELSFII